LPETNQIAAIRMLALLVGRRLHRPAANLTGGADEQADEHVSGIVGEGGA
jgi:hypothetical protein